MDELLKMIEGLLEQKTFGLDALKGIEKLRDQAQKQANQITILQKDVVDAENKSDRLDDENRKLRLDLGLWKQREKELAEREAKITALELSTAVAQAGLNSFRECAGMFLKNTTIRETISKNSGEPYRDQFGSTQYSNKSEHGTLTRETE